MHGSLLELLCWLFLLSLVLLPLLLGEVEDPEHPTTAVRSTLKMLSQLRRINDWSEKKDPPLPRVEIRCGVHTGKVEKQEITRKRARMNLVVSLSVPLELSVSCIFLALLRGPRTIDTATCAAEWQSVRAKWNLESKCVCLKNMAKDMY